MRWEGAEEVALVIVFLFQGAVGVRPGQAPHQVKAVQMAQPASKVKAEMPSGPAASDSKRVERRAIRVDFAPLQPLAKPYFPVSVETLSYGLAREAQHHDCDAGRR